MNTYGASLVIFRTTPEQQLAAWLFLKWFTEAEQQARWVEVSGYFPARRDVGEKLTDYLAANERYVKAFALLPYSRWEPPVAGYERVRRLIAETMVAAVDGNDDIDTLLRNLQARANATLAH